MVNNYDKEQIEIHIEDKIYPNDLKKIKNPPEVLYAIGNIKLLKKKKVAIVGTRKASELRKRYCFWTS